MHSERHPHTDEDLLDLAILWLPLGGPPPERIRRALGMNSDKYREQLKRIAHQHMQTTTARTPASLECVYSLVALATLTTE